MSDTGPRFDPRFLGAGVYCANDGSTIWLRRDPNWGEPPGAEIRLEPEALAELISYAALRGLIARKQ